MRRIKQDGRQHLTMFPLGFTHPNSGWVYAFGTSDGVTKIGMSGNPRVRAFSHWRKFRNRIEWFHLFSPVPIRRCGEIERHALRLASAKGQRFNGTEYFRGLSKADAIACVREALACISTPTKRKPAETAGRG